MESSSNSNGQNGASSPYSLSSNPGLYVSGFSIITSIITAVGLWQKTNTLNTELEKQGEHLASVIKEVESHQDFEDKMIQEFNKLKKYTSDLSQILTSVMPLLRQIEYNHNQVLEISQAVSEIQYHLEQEGKTIKKPINLRSNPSTPRFTPSPSPSFFPVPTSPAPSPAPAPSVNSSFFPSFSPLPVPNSFNSEMNQPYPQLQPSINGINHNFQSPTFPPQPYHPSFPHSHNTDPSIHFSPSPSPSYPQHYFPNPSNPNPNQPHPNPNPNQPHPNPHPNQPHPKQSQPHPNQPQPNQPHSNQTHSNQPLPNHQNQYHPNQPLPNHQNQPQPHPNQPQQNQPISNNSQSNSDRNIEDQGGNEELDPEVAALLGE